MLQVEVKVPVSSIVLIVILWPVAIGNICADPECQERPVCDKSMF